jgi:hypothetical protein
LKEAREADLVLVEHILSCIAAIDDQAVPLVLVRELPALRLTLKRMKTTLGG